MPDGGADMFSMTVGEIKKLGDSRKVEVLIPDFSGSEDSLKTVIGASPDVVAHNVETVPRLYPELRSRADYGRSLNVLRTVRKLKPGQLTKSGIMLGLGEKEDEIFCVMKDLLDAGCDFLSIGQYLAPSKNSYPVKRTIGAEEFELYGRKAKEMGFKHAESGTYVRTSYRAHLYL